MKSYFVLIPVWLLLGTAVVLLIQAKSSFSGSMFFGQLAGIVSVGSLLTIAILKRSRVEKALHSAPNNPRETNALREP